MSVLGINFRDVIYNGLHLFLKKIFKKNPVMIKISDCGYKQCVGLIPVSDEDALN
jgi:hypothetical protein